MISVICPVLNESEYIGKVIEFFINAAPVDKELLIVDGGSADGTIEIVKEWAKKYPNIYLLNNPDKYVPFALNIAIKKSAGSPVIRIDAHSEYAPDYFEKILEIFESTGADIVGGPYLTKSKTDLQNAVAIAISGLFGIGNSKAHNNKFRGYVDSVPYGAWKRELFDQVGYFDERFIRNQDDEFHYRAKNLGKKIYLNPEIRLWYYPRSTFKGLFRQYYEYGVYKPLVLLKIKSEIKIRHIIPSLFVLYILLLLPLSLISAFFLLPFAAYLIIDLVVSFTSGGSIKTRLFSIAVYPVIHLSYGLGFISGLFRIKGFSKGKI